MSSSQQIYELRLFLLAVIKRYLKEDKIVTLAGQAVSNSQT